MVSDSDSSKEQTLLIDLPAHIHFGNFEKDELSNITNSGIEERSIKDPLVSTNWSSAPEKESTTKSPQNEGELNQRFGYSIDTCDVPQKAIGVAEHNASLVWPREKREISLPIYFNADKELNYSARENPANFEEMIPSNSGQKQKEAVNFPNFSGHRADASSAKIVKSRANAKLADLRKRGKIK